MLESATRIGKYRIIEKIGTGGMADVYQAEDILLRRTVAMKVLPPEFARDPERIQRFEKEIRNLAALDHPNIVTIYDVGRDSGYHFYTMSLLPGGDLKERIHQGLAPSQSLDIFEQVADALRAAHAQGVIHRDIKPQNILFDSRERPLLTDMGIAKAIGSNTRMTKTGMIIGTPHYMSPEQARGKHIDHRSDLYSLGVVFYEMLTGTVPYEAEDTFAVGLMHINDPLPELPPSVSNYQHFINRLMAKNPDDRFSNATQLLSTIRKVKYGGDFSAETDFSTKTMPQNDMYVEDDPFSDMRRSSSQSRMVWGVIGVLALVIIAGAYFISQKSSTSSSSQGGQIAVEIPSSGQSSGGPVAINQQDDAEKTAGSKQDGPSIAESALQKEIGRLLEMANKDIEAERLTRPEGNNACDRYKAVLALDPNNEDARKGLIKIVEKYVELSDMAISEEEYATADKHLFNASIVIPSAEIIADARRRLAMAQEKKAEEQRLRNEESESMAAQEALLAEKERIAAQEAEAAERERIAAEKAEKARRTAYQDQMNAGNQALEVLDKEKALSSFEAALVLYPEDQDALEGVEKAKALTGLPKQGDNFTNSLQMAFNFIESGSYLMGSPESESGRDLDEQQHKVNLTQGYWLQTTEVTQKQWQAVMGKNPSRFSDCGDDCPVESVSWEDIRIFIDKLNQIAQGDKKVTYRLPSEAEWEYAARAGSLARFSFGDTNIALNNYGWYDRNASGKTHPTAQKRANAWGFYDMYGNVWEWCKDWYGSYPASEINDPVGPSSGSNRVLRGGSWFSSANMCRSAVRHSLAQDNRNFYLGFRLAATP